MVLIAYVRNMDKELLRLSCSEEMKDILYCADVNGLLRVYKVIMPGPSLSKIVRTRKHTYLSLPSILYQYQHVGGLFFQIFSKSHT